MTRNLMLDLETFSLQPNATITQIGAVFFDLTTPIVDAPKFEVAIDPQSQLAPHFHTDMSTVLWWMQPERNAAREAWLSLPRTGISEALVGLMTWMNPADDKEIKVWGNGAAFDNVVLRNAFMVAAGVVPWHHRSDRCYKTLREISKHPGHDEKFGQAHTALADACWQAHHLQLICEMMRINELP